MSNPDSLLHIPVSRLQRRSGRLLVVCLAGLAVASVRAGTQPTAAEMDWRPRNQLPASVRENLPLFCPGGYLPSGNSDTVDGLFATDGQAPLQGKRA